jgi:hypothetical protein
MIIISIFGGKELIWRNKQHFWDMETMWRAHALAFTYTPCALYNVEGIEDNDKQSHPSIFRGWSVLPWEVGK